MIIYAPDPLELLKDIKQEDIVNISLPSGGYISAQSIDYKQVKVLEIVSTDPMDYMDSKIQPGSIMALDFKV